MNIAIIMPVIFLVGILLIAMEDFIRVNKAAVSVAMCMIMWLLLMTNVLSVFEKGIPEMVQVYLSAYPELRETMSQQEIASTFLSKSLVNSFGDVASTLFFVLASMAIVEVLDSNGSFAVITRNIKTRKKRTLVWVFSLITFFLSAFLGNLATVIIIIAILRKIIVDAEQRMPFSCLCIIAANAGGSWSPIGDVTTLLLWSGGNVTAPHQVAHVILPALVMMAAPTLIMSLWYKKDDVFEGSAVASGNVLPTYDTPMFQGILLIIGLLSLLMVPVLQSVIGIPPYMCVLMGLALLWIITDLRSAFSKDPNAQLYKVSTLFSHLDIATVLFFLGILMSVEALKLVGVLTTIANTLNSIMPDPRAIAVMLGGCSSVLDNVALVAATMGMYPLAETGAFAVDSAFWTMLAFCAVTGGSILIIGSASGVTVMGLEKVGFGYYLKKFTPLALLGYLLGVGVCLVF